MTEHQPSGKRWQVAKTPVGVEIILNDGSQLSGALYLAPNERVSDLLNDTKLFLPFQQENGEILMVAKSAIALCKPLDRPD